MGMRNCGGGYICWGSMLLFGTWRELGCCCGASERKQLLLALKLGFIKHLILPKYL